MIIFNVININIYAIDVSACDYYSKIFNEILIKVIIFIKLFKYRPSIFNKFKGSLILKS